MVEKRPTVVLVEDEPVTRAAIGRLLDAAGFEVGGEAEDAEGAIAAAVRERPQICLVDINIPGGGIPVVREVSRRLPETAIVVLTASESRDDLIDAIRAGAAGYLVKSMDPDRISHALHGVLAGEAAIPRTLVAQLVTDVQVRGRHRVVAGEEGRAELTARETEILELMCEGLSGPQMAERLHLSPVTIRRHIAAIVSKLGVSDRKEAVALMKRGRST
jgi:DNA-binding NarL/FixJ family response regulator